MKKFLSLFVATILATTYLLAATKTIYCKMEQSWWKVDGAAIGCHTWGTGTGTNWPGVRMTPVAGQTDLWSIELDLNQVQNVIFTRVNASGDIADWGAKTKDLTIPTDDKNLFTITSSSAVWGDPGCDGEWSVYGTSPVVTEPAVTDITITGDKYVGTELTFAATVEGFSADPMIIYEVKAKDGEYTQAQGGKFTPTAAGDYTVKATAFYQPEEGDAEEASKEVNFTVTEAPVKEYYLVGWINGANSGCEDDYEALHAEYKFVDGQLKVTFTETSYVFVKTSDNSHWFLSESYVAPAAKVEATLAEGKAEKVGVNGNVEVTFTITENQDGTLTLAYEEATPVETKYYVTGNDALVGAEKAWAADAIEMNGTTYTFTALPAGDYKLKVTDGTWEHSWGYSDLSQTVATEGLTTDQDNNICFTVYTPNDVTVTISEGHILIINGNFKPEPAGTFDLTIVQDTLWSKDGAKIAAWTWGEELAGAWTEWATNNNDTLTLKVDTRADSIILIRVAGDATEPDWDILWNRIDAGEIDDCHLFIITDWNAGVWCERPTPVTPDYGLLVNGTNYLPGEASDKDTYTEYAVSTTLAIGDFVQLYDNVAKAAWTVEPEGEGFTDFDIHDGAYYIKQAGAYQFYIKIPKEGMNSALYVGFQASTGLNNVKALDGQRYNIFGQSVNETYRGIVIMNGQTYLQ